MPIIDESNYFWSNFKLLKSDETFLVVERTEKSGDKNSRIYGHGKTEFEAWKNAAEFFSQSLFRMSQDLKHIAKILEEKFVPSVKNEL